MSHQVTARFPQPVLNLLNAAGQRVGLQLPGVSREQSGASWIYVVAEPETGTAITVNPVTHAVGGDGIAIVDGVKGNAARIKYAALIVEPVDTELAYADVLVSAAHSGGAEIVSVRTPEERPSFAVRSDVGAAAFTGAQTINIGGTGIAENHRIHFFALFAAA